MEEIYNSKIKEKDYFISNNCKNTNNEYIEELIDNLEDLEEELEENLEEDLEEEIEEELKEKEEDKKEYSNKCVTEIEKKDSSINSFDSYENSNEIIGEKNGTHKKSMKLSIIEKTNDYLNDSLQDFGDFLKSINVSQAIEIIDKLFDNFKNIMQEKMFEGTAIRCIFKEKENSLFHSCDNIPFIEKDMNTIIFYDEKKNGKSLDIFELLKFILNNNKIFLKISENQSIINNAYICKEHNQNYFSYCIKCQINICEICLKDKHHNHEIFDLKTLNKINCKNYRNSLSYKISKIYYHLMKKKDKYEKYKKTVNIFQENNEFIKNIFILYKNIRANFILFIYFSIFKQIFCEQIFMNNNKLFNYHIYKNILYFYKQSTEISKKKHNKEKTSKIEWIIEFHLKEEKNDNNSNIYIGIDTDGYVIIYKFSRKHKKNKCIINYKKFNIKRAQKIFRLANCYNAIDKNNYYFLISSIYENKAIIIKVSQNYQSIEIIETINYNKGLIFCNEFKYKNNYYLLNICIGSFSLWYYDYNEKKLKYRILEEISEKNEIIKINENDKKMSYRIINFIEKLKLVIVQLITPVTSLNFYTLV